MFALYINFQAKSQLAPSLSPLQNAAEDLATRKEETRGKHRVAVPLARVSLAVLYSQHVAAFAHRLAADLAAVMNQQRSGGSALFQLDDDILDEGAEVNLDFEIVAV